MSTSERGERRYRRWFWLLFVAITLYRLVAAAHVGLSVDESHYLLYGRHLAWGYLDHPPMVGVVGAAADVPGHGLLLIRLGPILCYAIALVLLKKLAEDLYGPRVAFGALVLSLCMPIEQLLAVALLPDSTLNLFWCGALLAAWHAVREGRWWQWLLTGVLMGGALLSKYHGFLLLVCLFLYLLMSPQQRVWLRRPQPYAASVVALLVFLPNVLWNAHHEWISYAFQLRHGASSGEFSVSKVVGSLGGQALAASPVIFGLFVASSIVLLHRPRGEADRFVIWTSVPVFGFFCCVGMFGRILLHWPAVGWWSGLLAVASVVARQVENGGHAAVRWRRWSIAAVAVGVLSVAMLHVALVYPVIGALCHRMEAWDDVLRARFAWIPSLPPYRPAFDVTNELYWAPEVAAHVEAIRAAMPHPDRTFVFSACFYSVSQLAVYLDSDTLATTLNSQPDQYKLWFSAAEHKDWDAIFVDDERCPRKVEAYSPLFRRMDEARDHITAFRHGQPARSVDVYRFYGFAGKREGET